MQIVQIGFLFILICFCFLQQQNAVPSTFQHRVHSSLVCPLGELLLAKAIANSAVLISHQI